MYYITFSHYNINIYEKKGAASRVAPHPTVSAFYNVRFIEIWGAMTMLERT